MSYKILPHESSGEICYASLLKINDELTKILSNSKKTELNKLKLSICLTDEDTDVIKVNNNGYLVYSSAENADTHDAFGIKGEQYFRIGEIHRKLVMQQAASDEASKKVRSRIDKTKQKQKKKSIRKNTGRQKMEPKKSQSRKRKLSNELISNTINDDKKRLRKVDSDVEDKLFIDKDRLTPLNPLKDSLNTNDLKKQITNELSKHPNGLSVFNLAQIITGGPPGLLFRECLAQIGKQNTNGNYVLKSDDGQVVDKQTLSSMNKSTVLKNPQTSSSRVMKKLVNNNHQQPTMNENNKVWAKKYLNVIVPSEPQKFSPLETYEQYQKILDLHNEKFEIYSELGSLLNENSQFFLSFKEKLINCDSRDHQKRRLLKAQVEKFYNQRKDLVAKLVKYYRLLHLELSDLQKSIKNFVNEL